MIEPLTFRRVLGNYPTGVCAVTSLADDGTALGLVVGSFASVSLDPPLIAFFPDRRSRSWPRIQKTGKFCVNILASDQMDVCRKLSVSGPDKFDGLQYGLSDNGSPLLAGVLAWIDCDLHDVYEAGDHFAVYGRVVALEVGREADPMLFHRGRYGGFATIPA